jgi:hypothetical protein
MLVKNRRIALIVVLLAVLIPVAAYAYKICNKYSDGCTICDFYGPNGEYQGYISWCH